MKKISINELQEKIEEIIDEFESNPDKDNLGYIIHEDDEYTKPISILIPVTEYEK